jgi:hypothetical protein
VAEVDALLYLPGHSREQLERALRIPALSKGWQSFSSDTHARVQPETRRWKSCRASTAGISLAARRRPPQDRNSNGNCRR